MKVTYISACLDQSGYAEAARNNIAALDSVGVDVAVTPISFEAKRTDHGRLGNLIERLSKKDQNSDIRILHATPHHYPKLVQSGKYNIGYAAWETSLLPKDWVEKINLLNEVWVPSTHNVKAFQDSGVQIPIFCFPHTFNHEEPRITKPILENKNGDFTFYSIFQWLKRKNPAGLLKAFLTEFTANDSVCLAIKTFLINPGNLQEADKIKEEIKRIKKTLYLDNQPKILLISSLLTKDQMQSLHKEGDCYITLNYCEGFGIPIAEAMQAGHPVIATGYGGAADIIQHEDTGYKVDYMMTPVSEMPWDMYQGYMQWGEPDLMNARKYMRTVYENRQKAIEMGQRGKQWIQDNLSWQIIGQKMQARLQEIEVKIHG